MALLLAPHTWQVTWEEGFQAEMFRAVRLMIDIDIDIGTHARHWSREQAIDDWIAEQKR